MKKPKEPIAKIITFRISNYRSIKDSGLVLFPNNDRIFVLAGQNESGKTSIISALNDFEIDEYNQDSKPFGIKTGTQEIECSYEIIKTDQFIKDLEKNIAEKKNINLDDGTKIFSEKLRINRLTLTRKYDLETNESILVLDKNSFKAIMGSIKNIPITSEDGLETKKPIVDLTEEEVSKAVWRRLPGISLFEERDILPDKILVADLKNDNTKANGYGAVRNFEKIAKVNLVELASNPSDAERLMRENIANNIITVDFQNSWNQHIYGNNEVRIKFKTERDATGEQYINFYIETKSNEFLAPRQRSKGLIWFLSFWLELKATTSSSMPQIILIDEPGLYLHIKAQKDFLTLLEFLAGDQEKNQIIYSTHSPALIDTDYLYRIGLVINSDTKGTTIEKLTSSLLDTENKKDALQPIAEAMGLAPLKDFSILKQKNIIVEGLSDFHYFQALKSLLRPSADYEFVPGIGIKEGKINHLISFCIGYGLDWAVIIDDGKGSFEIVDKIKKEVFNENKESFEKKVKILDKINGIENLFTCEDLSLIGEHLVCTKDQDKAKVVGDSRKIMFAQIFHQKVNSKEITEKMIDLKTIGRFEKIFEFIDNSFVPTKIN